MSTAIENPVAVRNPPPLLTQGEKWGYLLGSVGIGVAAAAMMNKLMYGQFAPTGHAKAAPITVAVVVTYAALITMLLVKYKRWKKRNKS